MKYNIIYLGSKEMEFSSLVIIYIHYYYETINDVYFYKRSDMERGKKILENNDSVYLSEYLSGMLYEPRGNEKELIPSYIIRPLDELKNIVLRKILNKI